MPSVPIAQPPGAPYPHNLVTVTLNPAKAKLAVAKSLDQYVEITPTGVAVTVVVHASEVEWMRKAGIIV